mmetsp:Transcript_137101/g.382329  ORF Transcript_137101/g.382329 Transcript_137101/m.382329 type:complete len:240 (+) Transcript_137101:171-890(+)
MGQATTGLSTRRLCHTHEIAHEPGANEWQSLGQWTSEVEDRDGGLGGECRAAVSAAWGASCCAGEDGGHRPVEEVLVVHHDALRKVDLLLRVDELDGGRCELPAVPECVVAAKRAELARRAANAPVGSGGAENGGFAAGSEDEGDAGFDADGGNGTSQTDEDGDPAASPLPARGQFSVPPAHRPMPGLPPRDGGGPALQPRSQEPPEEDPEALSFDDLETPPPAVVSGATVPGATIHER